MLSKVMAITKRVKKGMLLRQITFLNHIKPAFFTDMVQKRIQGTAEMRDEIIQKTY